MYQIARTTQFKKDFKRIQKRHWNTDELIEVISDLAEGKTLDPKYRDHELTGNHKGSRECHIGPDFLLEYRIDNNVLILTLLRTGSHSDLFQ